MIYAHSSIFTSAPFISTPFAADIQSTLLHLASDHDQLSPLGQGLTHMLIGKVNGDANSPDQHLSKTPSALPIDELLCSTKLYVHV